MDFVNAIDRMATEAVQYQLRIADLEAKLLGKDDDKRKDWRESKAYQGLDKWDGCEKKFLIGSSSCSAS